MRSNRRVCFLWQPMITKSKSIFTISIRERRKKIIFNKTMEKRENRRFSLDNNLKIQYEEIARRHGLEELFVFESTRRNSSLDLRKTFNEQNGRSSSKGFCYLCSTKSEERRENQLQHRVKLNRKEKEEKTLSNIFLEKKSFKTKNDDQNFTSYRIIVRTGNEPNAGTRSKVR